MISKLNLVTGAFWFASVVGLTPAQAEGVAPAPAPAAAAVTTPAPKAPPKGKDTKGTTGKRANKTPAASKVDASTATTPAPAPDPTPEKMRELQQHPQARSGRGHL